MPTVYEVNIFNTMSRGKEVEGQVKSVKGKNLTDDGIMAEINKVQLNHDKIGGQGLDLNNYTQSMIRGAESGNAFASNDMLIDDVRRLVPERVEGDGDDDGSAVASGEDGEDGGNGDDSVEEPARKKPKKEVFIDMEKHFG